MLCHVTLFLLESLLFEAAKQVHISWVYHHCTVEPLLYDHPQNQIGVVV